MRRPVYSTRQPAVAELPHMQVNLTGLLMHVTDDQQTADMWAGLTRETWRARLRGVQRNVEVWSWNSLALSSQTLCGSSKCPPSAWTPSSRQFCQTPLSSWGEAPHLPTKFTCTAIGSMYACCQNRVLHSVTSALTAFAVPMQRCFGSPRGVAGAAERPSCVTLQTCL
jgi:hypothetical protein